MNSSFSNLNNDISLIDLLSSFWNEIRSKRKLQIKFLILLMLLSGISEIFSIGTLFPFLSALTNSESIFDNFIFKKISPFLGISNQNQLIFWMTLLFLTTVFISTAIRLINIWATGRLSAAVGTDLSTKAYGKTLIQPYNFHINKNSSALIATLTTQTDITISILQATLLMISALIILICILFTLFLVDWKIALLIISLFSIFYSFVRNFNKKKLDINGKKIDLITKNKVKSISEGYGSIKDIILQNNQKIYINEFRSSDLPLRILSAQNNLLASSPRFILEAFGLSLISAIAYFTFQEKNNADIIPVLGTIALGTQKVLPTSQIIYSSWANLKGCKASLSSVLELLQLPADKSLFYKNKNNIPFKEEIKFENVSFKYKENNKYVLKNLNLKINKGERVGFIGSTGSGKTTTIDLLMTLLSPTEGKIILDGNHLNNKENLDKLINWRSQIAHVPQNIYLIDGSILENIAFGIPKNEINLKKVRESAERSKINNFIESLPNGYETIVGERGSLLSGGQVQRIAIARALYKDSSVLIFDEATSALDNSTEKAIINSIKQLNKELTIIIIAHRISTVLNCNKIYELKEGSIVNVFTGEELAKSINDF